MSFKPLQLTTFEKGLPRCLKKLKDYLNDLKLFKL